MWQEQTCRRCDGQHKTIERGNGQRIQMLEEEEGEHVDCWGEDDDEDDDHDNNDYGVKTEQ